MFLMIHPMELTWFQTQYMSTKEEHDFMKKLNIKLPVQFPHDEKICLGRVEINDGSWVVINVTCLPSRLYEFIVHNSQTHVNYKIRTGVGDIRIYWKLVEVALLNKLHVLNLEQWIANILYYKIEETEL